MKKLFSTLVFACLMSINFVQVSSTLGAAANSPDKEVFGQVDGELSTGLYLMRINFDYGPSYETTSVVDDSGELTAFIDSGINWSEGAAIIVELFNPGNTSNLVATAFVFQERPPIYPPIPGGEVFGLPPYHSFPIDRPIIGSPTPHDPDDGDAGDGVTFDPDEPQHRTIRIGESVLDYTREVDENGNASGGITVDWVEGTNAINMLNLILISEGGTIPEITGFTTDRLGDASDRAITRFGNNIGNGLPGDWEVEVTHVGERRYITLTRNYDDDE